MVISGAWGVDNYAEIILNGATPPGTGLSIPIGDPAPFRLCVRLRLQGVSYRG